MDYSGITVSWPLLAALTAYAAGCGVAGCVVNASFQGGKLKQILGHSCALVVGGTAANVICQWAGCSLPALDLLILHAGLAYMIR